MSATPLISLQEATKGFSDTPLFQDLSLVISEGERVALIGNNGSGKSTILKILAGLEELDSGLVSARKGVQVAYASQQDSFPEDLTVGEAIDLFLSKHGFEHDEIARRSSVYLGRAGFEDSAIQVSTLSGGWKKRLSLAMALAREPECLLLDEPTNHLDIDSIEWLEECLSDVECAIVFVSHDRYFIECLADRVIEINHMYPAGYLGVPGGYSDYLEQREDVISQLQSQKQSLANKVRREVEWLRQGVKARTTKSKARISEAHRMIESLREAPSTERRRVELEFSTTDRKTKELLKVEKLSQSINGKTLFNNVSLVLSPGARLAVVGPNGSGKTTFVKTLLGLIPPQSGKVLPASQLRVTFLDQARSQLDDEITLKEFLAPHSDSVMFQGKPIHVAAWADRFLFSHQHLSRRLQSLSGGERARALLAKSISETCDILVFDEPTNDLDIATLENLEEGFENFPGAIVIITHDRYILHRIASMVLGIQQGSATLFKSYKQLEDCKKLEQSSLKQRAETSSKQGNTPKTAQKLSYKDARELTMIEGAIERAERAVSDLQNEINSGAHASNPSRLTELCSALTERQSEVERLYARWQELESLRASISERP